MCHARQAWDASPGPGPVETCTTCHGIPPATGKHETHTRIFIGCGACHDGYTSTVANASTHRNGNADVSRWIGFDASQRTCTSVCHFQAASWGGSGGASDGGSDGGSAAAGGGGGSGGCGAPATPASLLALLGVAFARARRRTHA